MFYKLGQRQALTDLDFKDPLKSFGVKKPGEGYFGITSPGSGAIMGGALGSSVGTTAHGLASLLGYDYKSKTGLTLPQLVALTGLAGAGVGAGYGSSLKK